MFNDIFSGTEDNEKECLSIAKLVSLYARKFDTRQWSFIGPGSEKKWYSMEVKSTRNLGQNRGEDVGETIETIFRIIVSANQLSLYGAVADMDEDESLHDGSGRPDIVMGQSSVLSAIKTEVPWDCDDPTKKMFYCNNMENELKNCHNK